MTFIRNLVLAGLATMLPLTVAYPTLITGGFTGSWFNSEQDGQGFQLQVLPNGEALAFWFTYDADGNQVWLIGNDTVVGNQVMMDMLRPVGGKFGPGFDPEDVEMTAFGSVTLTFEDCESGTVSWESIDPQFGFGSMPIERLTASAGVSCSASLADNRSGNDPVLDFKVPLLNDSPYPEAEAKAEYESRPGRVEFEVEIEDVPVGEYQLWVDGVERGIIQVETDDDDTEGHIDFSSPLDNDDISLDFEPLGKMIEITSGTNVLFSGFLDPEFSAPGDSDEDSSEGDAPPFGESEIYVDFDSTGLDPDASGDLEFEQYPGRVEFEVEIEDLDVETYELWVANELRGEITVVRFDNDTEGELEFSNPAEAGKLLLDFDPRGQLVTIERNSNVYLSVTFPTAPQDEDEDEDEDEDDDDDGDD